MVASGLKLRQVKNNSNPLSVAEHHDKLKEERDAFKKDLQLKSALSELEKVNDERNTEILDLRKKLEKANYDVSENVQLKKK